MTDEERDIITRFIQRVSGALPAAPGTPAQVLPPVDPAADQLIGELFAHYPEARYRLTQTAFVQEAAIKEVQSRLRALEAELQTTRDALAAARSSQAAMPAPRSGFFGGAPMPGVGPAAPAPQAPAANPWGPPAAAPAYPQQPPAYAAAPPPYAPQPAAAAPQAGSGFLGGALKTAAGVAGGVVAGNALMGLFSGHGGGFGGGGFGGGGFGQGGFGGGGFGQGAQPVNETIINNYGDAANPTQAGFAPPDPGYTPWGEPPEGPGSQALNDGYWSKDSVYQPEIAGPEVADNYVPDAPAPDFSDDSDLV